jgi:uncharacterized protein
MFLRSVGRCAVRSATRVRERCRSSAASVADVETGVLYLDTSALVKLVVREAETDALEEELARWSDLATSAITSVELSRAVARARTYSEAIVADEYAILGVLAAVAEIPLSDEVRATASGLVPVELRTLDAIHLASAMSLGGDLTAVPRMTRACSERPASTSSRCWPLSRLEPGAANSQGQTEQTEDDRGVLMRAKDVSGKTP